MNNKIIYKLILIIQICCMILMISISFTRFLFADDYDFILLIEQNNNNIYKYLNYMYYNWDGRNATVAGVMQAILVKTKKAELATLSWAILFIVSSFIIIKSLYYKRIENKLHKTIFLFLFIILLWFGMHSHISQTIYWSIGGIYTGFFFLFSVWFYFLNKGNYIPFLLSIIVGATTQNLAVGLFPLLFLDQKLNIKNKILHLVCIFIGLLYISIAPGNFVRSNLSSSEINIYSLFLSYIKVIWHYILTSKYLIIFGLAYGITIYKYLINRKPSYNIIIKFTLAALFTATPFVLNSNLAATRTAYYFHIFLFIATIEVGVYLQYLIHKKFLSINKFQYSFSKYIILCIALIMLYTAFYNLVNGIHLKNKIIEREQYLRSIENNNVNAIIEIIKIIPTHRNFAIHFKDIESNSNNFKNKSQSKFYKINKITGVE